MADKGGDVFVILNDPDGFRSKNHDSEYDFEDQHDVNGRKWYVIIFAKTFYDRTGLRAAGSGSITGFYFRC